MTAEELQIGDLVRTRDEIELVPIDRNRPPTIIPAGIYGEIVHMGESVDGELALVDFHEPFEFIHDLPLQARFLELVFRFPN